MKKPLNMGSVENQEVASTQRNNKFAKPLIAALVGLTMISCNPDGSPKTFLVSSEKTPEEIIIDETYKSAKKTLDNAYYSQKLRIQGEKMIEESKKYEEKAMNNLGKIAGYAELLESRMPKEQQVEHIPSNNIQSEEPDVKVTIKVIQ